MRMRYPASFSAYAEGNGALGAGGHGVKHFVKDGVKSVVYSEVIRRKLLFNEEVDALQCLHPFLLNSKSQQDSLNVLKILEGLLSPSAAADSNDNDDDEDIKKNAILILAHPKNVIRRLSTLLHNLATELPHSSDKKTVLKRAKCTVMILHTCLSRVDTDILNIFLKDVDRFERNISLSVIALMENIRDDVFTLIDNAGCDLVGTTLDTSIIFLKALEGFTTEFPVRLFGSILERSRGAVEAGIATSSKSLLIFDGIKCALDTAKKLNLEKEIRSDWVQDFICNAIALNFSMDEMSQMSGGMSYYNRLSVDSLLHRLRLFLSPMLITDDGCAIVYNVCHLFSERAGSGLLSSLCDSSLRKAKNGKEDRVSLIFEANLSKWGVRSLVWCLGVFDKILASIKSSI
ncbi:hypothetical protein BC829DRAFT_198181 [Chytridium lagenaria]|nr:hypothetical protein BC829DRAFT_198181 [Chytridium lagenaria]